MVHYIKVLRHFNTKKGQTLAKQASPLDEDHDITKEIIWFRHMGQVVLLELELATVDAVRHKSTNETGDTC